MFVIFDLDGTLSYAEHRMHLIKGPNPLWDEFYLQCIHDRPVRPVINIMRSLYSTGAIIEIWTGRSDFVHDETRAWFDHHGVPFVPMKMRPHGDHSSDVDLKRNWLYERIVMGQPKPDLVFEDRARVVSMWREEEIACAQVAPGDF